MNETATKILGPDGVAIRPAQLPAVQPPPVDPTDSGRVLTMIAQLSVDPKVNPAALKDLLDLQERIMDRQARMAFDIALMNAQAEMPIMPKDGKIEVREKNANTGRRDGALQQSTRYPKYETCIPIVLPILHKHGLSLTHRTARTPEGKLRITAVLKGHGHTDDSSYLDFEADVTGSKNNAQAWVSVQSYGRRATMFAALNLVAQGEDDDGKASGKPVMIGTPMSEEDFTRLVELAEAKECPRDRLTAYLSKTRPRGHPEFTELKDMPAERFDEAVKAIGMWKPEMKTAPAPTEARR